MSAIPRPLFWFCWQFVACVTLGVLLFGFEIDVRLLCVYALTSLVYMAFMTVLENERR